MKLTEKDLMLGDLISCKSIIERYAKITEIYKQLTPPFKQMVSLRTKGLRYCVPIDEIESIPLTEEILEANGWACDDINYSWYLDKFPDLYKHENGFLNYYDGIEVRFNYVHELQRALRVCGLWDKADNFKIE